MTRGNNRHAVFENTEDYIYYLELIERFKAEHPFELYHYCLMPNHVHFLVKTNKASDFSNFMKRLNLAYFHYYRKQYGWVGHFWQDRFKSQPVGKDEYFIQCGKYIELNPVRAGIVKNSEDYRYSSYEYYAKGKPNTLLTDDLFYEETGKNAINRQKAYQNLTIDEIVANNYSKTVWGSCSQVYQEKRKIKRQIDKK